jgi:hypothetical protein
MRTIRTLVVFGAIGILTIFVCVAFVGCSKPEVQQPKVVEKETPKDDDFIAFEPTDLAVIREKQILRDWQKAEFEKREQAIKAKYKEK